VILALVLSAGSACLPVDPAPDDLDGLAHWLWTNHLLADDGQVLEAMASAGGALSDLTSARSGTLNPLATDDVGDVEHDETADLTNAQGFFVATQFPCDMAVLDEFLTAPNQDELYDGYDEYSRSYTSDRAAYLAGDDDTLSWDIDLRITPINAQYHALFRGGMRRVGGDDPQTRSLLQFTWMPAPAEFEDENSSFEQDYQIEAYFPRGDDVVHFYSMWRDMRVGAFSSQDDAFLSALVDGLIDWDRRTEELCAAPP